MSGLNICLSEKKGSTLPFVPKSYWPQSAKKGGRLCLLSPPPISDFPLSPQAFNHNCSRFKPAQNMALNPHTISSGSNTGGTGLEPSSLGGFTFGNVANLEDFAHHVIVDKGEDANAATFATFISLVSGIFGQSLKGYGSSDTAIVSHQDVPGCFITLSKVTDNEKRRGRYTITEEDLTVRNMFVRFYGDANHWMSKGPKGTEHWPYSDDPMHQEENTEHFAKDISETWCMISRNACDDVHHFLDNKTHVWDGLYRNLPSSIQARQVKEDQGDAIEPSEGD